MPIHRREPRFLPSCLSRLGAFALAPLLAVACGGEAPDQPEPVAKSPKPGAAFAVWKDDFPMATYLSPPMPGQWYGFTRRQALERLVRKLAGDGSREGWLAAKMYFEHAPEEAMEVLLEALNAGMQSPRLAEHLENVVEALGRLRAYSGSVLGDALLRALAHERMGVRSKAMQAMESAGPGEAVRAAAQLWSRFDRKTKLSWIRAVRKHLPDEAAEIYAQMLTSDQHADLVGEVVEEVSELEPEEALRVLQPMWADAPPGLRLVIAKLMHQQGLPRGTRYLLDTMKGDDAAARAQAVTACTHGSLELVLDQILMLSVDEATGVRAAVATALAGVQGQHIDETLRILAVDPAANVRAPALMALRTRGELEVLDGLLDKVRTESGTRMAVAMADLVAAGDVRAVPVLVERLRAAADDERRKFLKAIALFETPEAFAALREVFLQPERPVDRAGQLTGMTYVGVLLPNLRACGDQLLALWAEVPREDHRRRATLLKALGNLASVTEDDAFQQRAYDVYRQVIADPEEIPQLRLLALEYLRRDLRLDDMQRIKRMQETEADPGMRKALTAFLFEFF